MPPSLLDLPRELRDLIYAHVLDNELPPPQTEEDLKDHYTPLDQKCFAINLGDCPISCAFPVQITTIPLLLVNRQIHLEFRPIIALAKEKKQLRYKLDCLILREEAIHLTWLRVPALSAYVAVLEVDFRLYSDSDGWYSAWPEGDRISCRMAKSLYSLLTWFLEGGPDLDKPRRRGVEVGVLMLDVVTPLSLNLGWLVPGECSLQVGEEADPYVQWQNEVRASPETVVGELEDGIVGLLGLSISYTSLLYERIGVISIRLDGKERRAFDLKAMACGST